MNRIQRLWWCGLLLATTACAALAAPPKEKEAPGKQLLRIKLDGPVLERPKDEFDLDFSGIFGAPKPQSQRHWLTLIDKAARDPKIAGLILIVEEPVMSLAQAEELTRALRAFRATGKKVHGFLDYGTNLSYALATAADDVTVPAHTELFIPGLAGEVSFYKGLFDKIGVEAQMLHCGAYKAALEPYTRAAPSPEFAENINWLFDGLYERWLGMIAAGRKLDLAEVRKLIDQAPFPAAVARERKLIDHVDSFDGFRRRIQKQYGDDVVVLKKLEKSDKEDMFDPNNPFAFFQALNKMFEEAADGTKDPGVGLVYLDGPIMTGRNQPDPLSGETSVGSTTIRAALEQARTANHIKAVVMRVNSPGGSAIASDIIWEAATRLAREKPLIVSMGGVAGSGGYYVSIPAHTIFAEETTLTASIGVVGGKLVWKGLMEEKLGITTTEFNRGKRAGLFSLNRKWSDDEQTVMTTMMEGIYTQFKERITASRGDRIKGRLEDHAEGRVFTGRQALERGLVDRLGGLQDALELAIEKGGLDRKNHKIYQLPKPRELADIFKQLMGEEPHDDYAIPLAGGGAGLARATTGNDSAVGPPHEPVAGSTDEGVAGESRIARVLQALPRLLTAGMAAGGCVDVGGDGRAFFPLLEQVSPHVAQSARRALRMLALLERERVACFMTTLPAIR